jgi:PKD repeat protein
MDFSYAGVNDANWTVVIAWGDGNSTTISNVTTQAIANQSHTYNTPGTYTPTVTVTDKDGGEGSAAAGSLVVSQEYTATFLQPFDATTASNFVINQAKAGRTVPVKVQIYDVCAQRYLTGSDALPFIGVSTATTVNGSDTDAIEVYADAGAANDNGKYFRWSTDGFWIYNLDTRTALNGGPLVTGSTYRINVFDGAGLKVTDDEWALLKQVR